MNEKAQELNYSSSTLSEELKIAKNGAIWRKGFGASELLTWWCWRASVEVIEALGSSIAKKGGVGRRWMMSTERD
jgi:hypothetical protein